jgi:glc operon protein GlcG
VEIPGFIPANPNRRYFGRAQIRSTKSEEKIMSLSLARITALALAGVFAMTTHAQNPVPATAAAPPLPYGAPIAVEAAKKAAAAALAEAKKNGWFMAIAVVDPSGTLVYYEKMDNTQIGSSNVAINKAKTSAMFKRPTKAFQDALAGGGAGLRVLGLQGVTPVEGGVPIIVNNQIIGAIGVSGAASDQDAVCAQAGANAVK